MCGIAGYSIDPAGVRNTPWLESARAALAHRGPDSSGLFEDQAHGIGLVHTRLSILDLSPTGHQPMVSDDGRVVVVFNGEIYNFRELRQELESRGHRFQGTSDTEVLLRQYLEFTDSAGGGAGDVGGFLKRLNGIFALALWDRETQALLVARDALGVKPLYYRCDEQGVHFASEIKALPTDHLTLDAAALDRYLTYLWCPGSGTPATEIRKVAPGEALWIARGRVRERLQWYQLLMVRGAAISTAPKEQIIHQTVSLVRQAVHRQMVADVSVGAFLSGGLDSSSVVAFAREVNPAIRCFTIETSGAVDEGTTDDLPYARQVANHLRVPLDVVRVDADRMAEDLVSLVAQLDEPLADPAALNVLYISRLARETGTKVLLSGAGGDDLFTGYRRHRALTGEALWSWLPQPVRRGLERLSTHLDYRRPLSRRLAKAMSGAGLSADQRLVHYFRWTDRQLLRTLYTPQFTAALADANAEDPMRAYLEALPAAASPLERMLALEQRFFLADHNLTYTDKMSMAVGVETRVPFLDLELVEFASTIPAHYKQRGNVGKWVLKKAMEPYLPSGVIYRPKTGFGAPLRRWMRGELRALLADVLSEQRLKARGLFQPDAVQRLIQANDQGRVDASYTLFSLICIELWCERFMDRDLTSSWGARTHLQDTPPGHSG